MTDAETPPRAPVPWIYAVLLVLAATMTACTVTLNSAGEPKAPRPTRTAVPRPTRTPKQVRPPSPSASPSPTPSPIPRLEHLEVPADVADPDAAGNEAPPAATVIAGTVTLERRGDFFVAPARIAGQAIGDILLDTGAGATFIDQRVADERHLPEIIAASTDDSRTSREASIRELHSLAIGDLPLASDRTFVVDLREGDALIGGPLAGVIGLAAFGAAPFTLDFTTGSLTVHTDATFDPPAGIQAEALRMDQGLPFVEMTLADGTAVWLLLDSGSAPAITVWRGFAKQHPGMIRSVAAPAAAAAAPTPDPATPAATPPLEPPRGSELRSFRLFGERYDRAPVLVQDPPARPWQRARVVGRVGMALLRDLRITIHPATERIWAERMRSPNVP